MKITDFYQDIILTDEQLEAVKLLEAFFNSNDRIFILKGYAGTGKTTILKGVVNYLKGKNISTQLMAPTGRAAKIISQKTGLEATTIHKGIYSFEELDEIKTNEYALDSFVYEFKLRDDINAHQTIFLIDEASMISNLYSEGEFFRFGSGYLLKDLIQHSKILNSTSSSKIVFIGDPAQLPPIGMNFSPALDYKYLQKKFKLDSLIFELTEVKRQNNNNHVLNAATKIRKSLKENQFSDFNLKENGTDIFNPDYSNFLETYRNIKEKKIVICYKNKTALDINTQIRINKFGKELPVTISDHMISGSNNYNLGIMNGEFAVVLNVADETVSRDIVYRNSKEEIEKYGKKEFEQVQLIWRYVQLLISEGLNGTKTIEGYLLENYLYGDNFLSSEETKALYVDFKNRHNKLKAETPEFKEAIKNDIFFNCFMLKFGYAITCHKAQGGEWPNVLVVWDKSVDSNFNFYEDKQNNIGKTNADFYRWAYTAITRTSKNLYCINPPYFTSLSTMKFIDIDVQESFNELEGNQNSIIEIDLNDDLSAALHNFNLNNSIFQIQNHFIKRWYALQKHYIDISNFEIKGYEIRYVFSRENDKCSIKYWVNSKNEFNSKYEIIRSLSNSDSFVKECVDIINQSPNITLKSNTIYTMISNLDFQNTTEKNRCFLENLKEQLNKYNEMITIQDLEHLNFRERYTFIRGEEKAVVDFEYDSDGFFGRVLPIPSKCNSNKLLQSIKNIIYEISFL